MILLGFIILPMIGGILAWIAARKSLALTRWISLITVGIGFLVALAVWVQHGRDETQSWLMDFSTPWIPRFGISFHLALDGLSLLLVLLTFSSAPFLSSSPGRKFRIG